MKFNQIDHSLEIALDNLIQYEHAMKKKQIITAEIEQMLINEKEFLAILNKENRDVDRIKGLSFQAFLGTLTGTLSDKIQKEELEALEAKNKYDRICMDLSEHYNLLDSIEKRINSLSDAKVIYENTLEAKRKLLSEISPTILKEINKLENYIDELKYQLKEVNEAEQAADDLWNYTCAILDTLESAKNWGYYDMVGGGVIATSIKRDKMSTARNQINVLNRKIDNYCKELRDVNIDEITHIDLESLNFLDYFVNSIFIDWQVQENINKAITKIKELQDQIKHNIKVLNQKKDNNLSQSINIKASIEKMIINA